MDLSKVIEKVIEEKIEFAGETVTVGIAPNAYTAADSADFDQFNIDSVIGYLLKGLKSWDLDWNGEPFEINEANLKTKVPESFLVAIADKIQEVKTAQVGKPKKRG